MVKMTIVAGRTRHERKAARKDLGSLKANTVSPRTLQRYDSALRAFYLFCQVRRQRIPDDSSYLDSLFSEYIEHLWEEGEGLSLATDGLSGLQDLRPNLKGTLQSSWRLVKTWQRREVPQRAPPLPEQVLQVLCGYFLHRNMPNLALALEVAFYGVLRTGELLQLQARHIDISPTHDCAVFNLGATKTSQRSGASDSVTFQVKPVCIRLKRWKERSNSTDLLVPSEYHFRQSFDKALEALKLDGWAFRPYSLRRGGATMYFRKRLSLDYVKLMGRWASDRTVRVYINDGLAQLASMQVDVHKPPLKQYFSRYLHQQRLDHGMISRGSG